MSNDSSEHGSTVTLARRDARARDSRGRRFELRAATTHSRSATCRQQGALKPPIPTSWRAPTTCWCSNVVPLRPGPGIAAHAWAWGGCVREGLRGSTPLSFQVLGRHLWPRRILGTMRLYATRRGLSRHGVNARNDRERCRHAKGPAAGAHVLHGRALPARRLEGDLNPSGGLFRPAWVRSGSSEPPG
jgi:hypothetical protein